MHAYARIHTHTRTPDGNVCNVCRFFSNHMYKACGWAMHGLTIARIMVPLAVPKFQCSSDLA